MGRLAKYRNRKTSHRNASNEAGLHLTITMLYDEENTMYKYSLEVANRDAFDKSLLLISMGCPFVVCTN